MAIAKPDLSKAWGQALALAGRTRRVGWPDMLVLGGLAALIYGLVSLDKLWTAPSQAAVVIDLSPWRLPEYTFYSVSRGLIAYCCSLIFTLVYGYWAAKDKLAARILIPALDILQSIPVLSFLPILGLALIGLFPHSNMGLELMAILLIFTGQAWNMTFSFYHSVNSVPLDQREVAATYRFTAWQRFRWVELPFSMTGLVWNSMMSMAGGWFFLMVCEDFPLNDQHFRLPGLGSYMSAAVEKGDFGPMIWAVAAMTFAIVAIDQLLWRPMVVWAQKFRIEEGGGEESMSSWFLNWLRRSHVLNAAGNALQRLQARETAKPRPVVVPRSMNAEPSMAYRIVSYIIFVVLIFCIGMGLLKLVALLKDLRWLEWLGLFYAGMLTFARVAAAVILGTLWTVPAGLAIGLSPRLSRICQPIVQVVASFPAPMLFPMVILVLQTIHVSLNWGSIALMLLGTQWYVLFNVVAGAMAIPADLREMARSYRITGWQRFRVLYLPAIFPYLVTGWVTATGGAWNVSIVAECMPFRGQIFTADGLGEKISVAAGTSGASPNYPLQAASVLVMATIVVVFNRLVWRRLYNLASTTYSLNK